jgi:hypothetical protein
MVDPNGRETARRLVRDASARLRRDRQALSTAQDTTREAGTRARAEDLRQAVLAAAAEGVPASVIAADAGVDTSVVEQWIAVHTFHDRLR